MRTTIDDLPSRISHVAARNGDEVDATTSWRHVLTVFQRPGVARKTKERMNRRDRRQVRQILAVR